MEAKVNYITGRNSESFTDLEEAKKYADKWNDKSVHFANDDFYDDDFDEYDEDEDDDDYYERQQEELQEELQERAMNCTCGAWKLGKSGEVYHVADCCCGAE